MRTRAFTLLEVLVALAVFGVAAVGLGAAYVNVLNAYDLAGRGHAHEDDVRFARAQLLAEADPKKVEEGADFDGINGARVRWRGEIEPTQMPDLFQVTFTCEINETGKESRPPVVETFVVLRPTWSEGVDSSKLREDAKERIMELRQKIMP